MASPQPRRTFLVPGLNLAGKTLLLQRGAANVVLGAGDAHEPGAPAAAAAAAAAAAVAAAAAAAAAGGRTRRRLPPKRRAGPALRGAAKTADAGAGALDAQLGLSARTSVISSKALPPQWQGPAETVLDGYASETAAALQQAARRDLAARPGGGGGGGGVRGGVSVRRRQPRRRRTGGGAPGPPGLPAPPGRASTAGGGSAASDASPRAAAQAGGGLGGAEAEGSLEEEEGDAVMAQVFLRSSSPEPPALRTAPQMFPLRYVAAAFGRELPQAGPPGAAADDGGGGGGGGGGARPPGDGARDGGGAPAAGAGVVLTVLGPVPAAPSAAATAAEWERQRAAQRPAAMAAAGAPPAQAPQRQSATAKKRPGQQAPHAAPPLPLPPVTDAVQLQLRSLTASPVVAAHYSKAELLLASVFETLQPRARPAAAAPPRRPRTGAGRASGAGAGAAAAGGKRPATAGAAAAGGPPGQQEARPAADADGGGAAGSGRQAAAPAPQAGVPQVGPGEPPQQQQQPQPASKRTTRSDARVALPPDATAAPPAAGRTSQLRARLLASADERRRRAADRAAAAGWGRASVANAAAACASAAAPGPACAPQVPRRCVSAASGLYPPGARRGVLSPAELLLLAPAPLASQAPGWSVLGHHVGPPSPRPGGGAPTAAAAAAAAGGSPRVCPRVSHSPRQQHPQHPQQQPPQAFRFAFERQLAAGGPLQRKLPAAGDIDDAIARQPPAPAALPANYAFGDVGRLLRRYAAQGGGDELDLSHALAGPAQVPALAQALGAMPRLTALALRNDGLDDWALQLLTAALLQPACRAVCSLDLAANLLGPDAPAALVPLLREPPPPPGARRRASTDAAPAAPPAPAGGGGPGSLCGPQAAPRLGPQRAVLTRLVLAGNAVGDAGAEAVFRTVAVGDAPLELLDLSGCGVAGRCAAALQAMLEGARQLRVLRLGWNSLGLRAARALAEGLRLCSSLEQLHLAWSGVTDAGAAHALEINTSVALLDASGCGVSPATCSVLVETLAANSTLQHLVLQDNPLGATGARKLLRAVHSGAHHRNIDLAGCGFLRPLAQAARARGGGGAATSGEEFNPRDANGAYGLDLSQPAQRQVAVELLRLAAEHGIESWRSPMLSGRPLNIKGLTPAHLPSKGLLQLEFASDKRPSLECEPLSDEAFDSLWTAMTDPARLTQAAAELALSCAPGGGAGRPPARPTSAAAAAAAALSRAQRRAPARGTVAVVLPSPTAAAGRSGCGGGSHVHAVTDAWKLDLLSVLAGDIVAGFHYGEDRVQAAVKVFGRIIDPENFATQVYARLTPGQHAKRPISIIRRRRPAPQAELADARIGVLRLFSPANPTGRYALQLGHQTHHMVAARLFELYQQQLDAGLCEWPLVLCINGAALDGRPLEERLLREPHLFRVPREGELTLSFTDLRAIPDNARPLSKEQFAVLVARLVGDPSLDADELAASVDAAGLAAKAAAVGRFETWTAAHPLTGKVAAMRRASADPAAVRVRDTAGLVAAVRFFSIQRYLTSGQLVQLLSLLPASDPASGPLKVELASAFWARCPDRRAGWSDVLRALPAEQQVALCQRLGHAVVFDPVRPGGLHYRLRMWRPDEYQIAWRLHRMALTAQHGCFENFCMDGVPKKFSESANLWSIMRGNAAESATPTVTLDFDFVWPDTVTPQWAATVIQSAWRSYMQRQRMGRPRPSAAPLLVHRRPGSSGAPPPSAAAKPPAAGAGAGGQQSPWGPASPSRAARQQQQWESLFGAPGSRGGGSVAGGAADGAASSSAATHSRPATALLAGSAGGSRPATAAEPRPQSGGAAAAASAAAAAAAGARALDGGQQRQRQPAAAGPGGGGIS
ncbi:hypothetical protein Rsub_04033 [Raphidocelis subcapitata]|uniref:Uncharacterized protein n=1 Tax=Raphidocelis subcapitata TaxID=307507 RepID=A0A2V0NWL4_9CHLO|nr:hypothetical protein Rsub_04033 [Raphidocelis subcapitata]|eukprot:GBF91729.1 hypothetical protein Rsub_04033 [Raphidocelis subcapitata]